MTVYPLLSIAIIALVGGITPVTAATLEKAEEMAEYPISTSNWLPFSEKQTNTKIDPFIISLALSSPEEIPLDSELSNSLDVIRVAGNWQVNRNSTLIASESVNWTMQPVGWVNYEH